MSDKPKCILPEQPIKTGVAMFANESGGVLANPEQPNQNLLIILEIECLISQVNKKLHQLPTDGMLKGQGTLRGQALEEIDLFQKTTLHDLRKEFE